MATQQAVVRPPGVKSHTWPLPREDISVQIWRRERGPVRKECSCIRGGGRKGTNTSIFIRGLIFLFLGIIPEILQMCSLWLTVAWFGCSIGIGCPMGMGPMYAYTMMSWAIRFCMPILKV